MFIAISTSLPKFAETLKGFNIVTITGFELPVIPPDHPVNLYPASAFALKLILVLSSYQPPGGEGVIFPYNAGTSTAKIQCHGCDGTGIIWSNE